MVISSQRPGLEEYFGDVTLFRPFLLASCNPNKHAESRASLVHFIPNFNETLMTFGLIIHQNTQTSSEGMNSTGIRQIQKSSLEINKICSGDRIRDFYF